MNGELKKVVNRVKTAQESLQAVLKNQKWMEDARRYAERQGKEVKKLLSSDLGKVRTFIERERKELDRFQRQIPGEVKKLRAFVEGQRKELEKLLKNVRAVNLREVGNGSPEVPVHEEALVIGSERINLTNCKKRKNAPEPARPSRCQRPRGRRR